MSEWYQFKNSIYSTHIVDDKEDASLEVMAGWIPDGSYEGEQKFAAYDRSEGILYIDDGIFEASTISIDAVKRHLTEEAMDGDPQISFTDDVDAQVLGRQSESPEPDLGARMNRYN